MAESGKPRREKQGGSDVRRVRRFMSLILYVVTNFSKLSFRHPPTCRYPTGGREKNAEEKGIGMNRRPTTSWFRILILRVWRKISPSRVILEPEEGAGKLMEREQMTGGLLSSFLVRQDVYACSVIVKHYDRFLSNTKLYSYKKLLALT